MTTHESPRWATGADAEGTTPEAFGLSTPHDARPAPMNGSARAGIPSISSANSAGSFVMAKCPPDQVAWIHGDIRLIAEADTSSALISAIEGASFMVGERVAKGWIDLAGYRGALKAAADKGLLPAEDVHQRVNHQINSHLANWAKDHPAHRNAIEAALEAERQAQASAARLGNAAVAEVKEDKELARQRQTERIDQELRNAADSGEQHRGQLRMAERMLAQFASRLIYVTDVGWHEWDGTRWKRDETGVAYSAAKLTLKSALVELSKMGRDPRNDLHADIRKCESASGLEGMVRLLEKGSDFVRTAGQLDADPYLFNTAGGTLDLRTGEVRPHDPRDLITKVAPHHIGDGDRDGFERFLREILPDDEEREYLQKVIGYSMLGEVIEEIMPVLTGTGANGKSTVRDAFLAAFGDYAVEVDPALLMESKHERHATFKMQLRGARLVFTSETDKGRRFNEAAMKRLTGGEKIEANLMHKNPIRFDPSHTLVMQTNHLPNVSGDDPALWRRIRVIPFDVVIPEDRQDKGLRARLKRNAGAVLAWAYEGYQKYAADGRLKTPEKVARRTDEYRAGSDTLGQFFEACTQAQGRVKARALYNLYKSWCAENGEDPESEVVFSRSMKAREFEKKTVSKVPWYVGLSVDLEKTQEQSGAVHMVAQAAVSR